MLETEGIEGMGSGLIRMPMSTMEGRNKPFGLFMRASSQRDGCELDALLLRVTWQNNNEQQSNDIV